MTFFPLNSSLCAGILMIRTHMHYAESSRRTPSAPRWTACKRSAAWRCWRAPASSYSPAAARSTRPRRRTCPSGPHPVELTMTRTRMSPGCSSFPMTHGAPARRMVRRRAPPVWPLPPEKPLICSNMMQLIKILLITIFLSFSLIKMLLASY